MPRLLPVPNCLVTAKQVKSSCRLGSGAVGSTTVRKEGCFDHRQTVAWQLMPLPQPDMHLVLCALLDLAVIEMLQDVGGIHHCRASRE